MIPADIDNFKVTRMTNMIETNGWIFIKKVNTVPKEISNCAKLTHFRICQSKIKDISALSNCKLLNTLILSDNIIEDISSLSKCTLLSYVDLKINNIQRKPIFNQHVNIFY